MSRLSFSFIFVILLFGSFTAQAKTFKNAYISFEMQDDWKCGLEQTEWVCRAEDPQEAKEAVIILTAKEKGPTDTFAIYETHLNTPINTTGRTGEVMTSILKYKAQKVKINDHLWLDGLHQDSEVKNYFTRYMGTTKDEIAILVTFSAHNKYYAKHSGNFDKTIRSLRVVPAKDIHKFMAANNQPYGSEKYGNDYRTSEIADGPTDILRSPASQQTNRKAELAFGFGILAAAIFLISKLMGKKKF